MESAIFPIKNFKNLTTFFEVIFGFLWGAIGKTCFYDVIFKIFACGAEISRGAPPLGPPKPQKNFRSRVPGGGDPPFRDGLLLSATEYPGGTPHFATDVPRRFRRQLTVSFLGPILLRVMCYSEFYCDRLENF